MQEYYILDDRPNRYAEFYRLNASGIYAPIPRTNGGDVIQSDVLPGFQFRVSDLYQQPRLLDLVEDPIYQGFIKVEYQHERLRAERFAAKLRELGVDPEQL